jgi:hypothetical protein
MLTYPAQKERCPLEPLLNAVKDTFTLNYISIIDHCFRSSAVFLKLNNGSEISASKPGFPHVGQLFSIKNNMIIIKGKTGAAPIENGNPGRAAGGWSKILI